MQKLILVVLVALAAVSVSLAAPICTEGIAQGTDVTAISSCSIGGLVFSNFAVLPSLNSSGAAIGLADATFGGAVVNLTFGTNFNAINPTLDRDVIFTYMVTGGLLAIDGTLGGTGTRTIEEVVCGLAFVGSACTDLRADLFLTAQNPTGTMDLSSTTGSTFYVRKDITIGANSSLSDFTQSFDVPEPVSFVLIGSGLLGLGLLRRRVRS